MHKSPDLSSCPPHEKINRDIFLNTLRQLALSHTLRETQEILAQEVGMTVTYDSLKKIAQRHGIQFQRAVKGGVRPGAGRPRGTLSAERLHGCSWVRGDYARGRPGNISAAGMPPVPFEASKKTGLARYDMAWVLRVGSRLGPSDGLPDGADSSSQDCSGRTDKIEQGLRFSGIRRS